MPRKTPNLSLKEQTFIREYLKDENGTRAAIAAGYSAHSAHTTAHKMLKKGKVAAEMARIRENLCAELEISAKKVLQGLAQLAFFDPRKFFHAEDVKDEAGVILAVKGSLKNVTELDDATVMALCGIEVEKLYKHFAKGQAEEVGTISKIKMADRGLNLERLGRHLKLFTDKLEVTDGDKMIEKLRAARARLAARPANP